MHLVEFSTEIRFLVWMAAHFSGSLSGNFTAPDNVMDITPLRPLMHCNHINRASIIDSDNEKINTATHMSHHQLWSCQYPSQFKSGQLFCLWLTECNLLSQETFLTIHSCLNHEKCCICICLGGGGTCSDIWSPDSFHCQFFAPFYFLFLFNQFTPSKVTIPLSCKEAT